MRRLIDEGVRLVFLLLAILLPGAGAHAGGSSSCTAAMTSRVDFLLETQGPVVYAGFFALSRTRGTFLDAAGDQAWITHAPEAIPELLSTARKEALRCAIGGLLEGMRNRARDDFLERLRRWLQVLAQFRACEQATSPEETMAAVYYLPATRGFFDTALKGRNLPSSVLPLQVGTTLSSAEHSIITYSLLNRISLMNLREQLTYFRDLYNTLVDALGATAAGKPSSRQPNETHLAALQPENPRCVLKDARFKVSARIRVGQGYVGGDAPIFEPGYKIELISPQGMRGKGVRIVSVNATQQPWGHLLDPQPLELGKTYRVSDCWRGETEFDYWLVRAVVEPGESMACGGYRIAWSNPEPRQVPGKASLIVESPDGVRVLEVLREAWSPQTIAPLWCEPVLDTDDAVLGYTLFGGGADCCWEGRIVRLGQPARELLKVNLGHYATLEPRQLDGEGPLELVAKSDLFASFADLPEAFTPYLPLVFAYNGDVYVEATRRFDAHLETELKARIDALRTKSFYENAGDALGIFGTSALLGQEGSAFDELQGRVSPEVVRWLEKNSARALAKIDRRYNTRPR